MRGAEACRHSALAWIALLVSVGAWAEEAELEPKGAPRGEIFASFYAGKAWNIDSDLEYRRPDGTRVIFRDVRWLDESFTAPIYYGFRAGYWLHPAPRIGIIVDFTHAKAISKDQIPELDPVEISHGLNSLTLNVAYRGFPRGHRDGSLLGRLQPYVGAGAGVAIPNVQVGAGGNSGYQAAGPAVQGFLGSHVDIWGPLALFTEYKFNWADLDMSLDNGGRLKTSIWTHQIAFGLSLWLAWGSPPAA